MSVPAPHPLPAHIDEVRLLHDCARSDDLHAIAHAHNLPLPGLTAWTQQPSIHTLIARLRRVIADREEHQRACAASPPPHLAALRAPFTRAYPTASAHLCALELALKTAIAILHPLDAPRPRAAAAPGRLRSMRSLLSRALTLLTQRVAPPARRPAIRGTLPPLPAATARDRQPAPLASGRCASPAAPTGEPSALGSSEYSPPTRMPRPRQPSPTPRSIRAIAQGAHGAAPARRTPTPFRLGQTRHTAASWRLASTAPALRRPPAHSPLVVRARHARPQPALPRPP